jgi:hypothetical protein
VPWYNNSCVTGEFKKASLGLGIDAIGLIPEGGGVARLIGHGAGFRGVVADQAGKSVIKAFKGSTNALGGASAANERDWTGIGLTIAGFVPGLGQTAALGSILNDANRLRQAIAKCP